MSIHRVGLRMRQGAMAARALRLGLVHPGVEVGRKVSIGKRCRLFLDPGAHLVLGDGCAIDDYTTIAIYGVGRIELGAASFIGHHCTLAARETIRVGNGAFLAELVSIRDHDHAVGHPPSSGRMTVDPVDIGADAWLGSKVTVLKGATVGEGTVVGANAVVRGHLPKGTVCAGVPARVIRTYAPPSAEASASGEMRMPSIPG